MTHARQIVIGNGRRSDVAYGLHFDRHKSYVGAPITNVMLDYRPPDNIYNLGTGQQAYQWHKNTT